VIRTIRTITLNHNHPDVAQSLGEAPAAKPAPAANHVEHTPPSLSKPGGDSRLAQDLKALTTDPQNHDLEYRVGERLHQLGRHSESLEHLRRAISLAPRVSHYHAALVRSLLANQRNSEALTACQAAAGQFDACGELQQLLAGLLTREGEYTGAVTAYRRAAGLLEAGDENLWLEYAHAHQLAGQYDQALGVLKEGLRRLPESKALLREVGRLQDETQHVEAERLGQRAAALASQIGHEDEAISTAQEALKLSERIYQPYYALGEVYVRRGEWGPAAEAFEKAVSLSPSPSAVYAMRMQLVQLYERLGRIESANAIRALLS
jgi:tetratricopeptide (TPR) repeat protein